jgi:sugar phosphate permease
VTATDERADPVAAELTEQIEGLKSRLPPQSLRFMFVMLAVTAVDFSSRSTLAVVFDDIKAEFGVSDTALGMLVAAFSVVATLSAIPFGVLADRWRRTRLIALGFVPWGLAMIWQGVATSFAMLFVARMFLGTIEASNEPASSSLIGDFYVVGRRARIMGLWRVGAVIGSGLGFAIAGVLATAFGWRWSFVGFGVTGLACALMVQRLLPEPERGVADELHRVELQLAAHQRGEPPAEQAPTPPSTVMTFRYAVRAVLSIPTARVMLVAAAIGEFVFSGIGAWAATFFRRYHGLDAQQSGLVNIVILVGVLVGAYVGSGLGDRMFARRNLRGRVLLGASCFSLSFAMGVPAFWVDSTVLSVALLTLFGFFLYIPVPGLWAMWLDIIPANLRGRAAGIAVLARTGLSSLAPAAFGVISDAAGLRTAFIVVMPALLLNGLIYLLARNSYPLDAMRAQGSLPAALPSR